MKGGRKKKLKEIMKGKQKCKKFRKLSQNILTVTKYGTAEMKKN